MKKLLLLFVAIMISFSAFSQRPKGFVVDNFKYKDVNGNTVELYKLLDSGYSVLIDISAVWCGPCWNFHASKTMEKLMTQYGPNGTIAPKKVFCVYIEGDATTAKSLLYGPKSTVAPVTQGDWVTGANYPIIDTNALNTELAMRGFPLLTLICPDRKVVWTQSGASATDISSTIYNQVLSGCPTTGMTSAIDFGISMASNSRTGGEFGYVSSGDSFNSNVRFFNSSTTVANAASFAIRHNSTNLSTVNWTGKASLKDSINRFGVTGIKVQPIASGYLDTNYSVSVTASGDMNSGNNSMKIDPVFVYSNTNAKTPPFTLDFEGVDFANGKQLPVSSRYLVSTVMDQICEVYDITRLTSTPTGINGDETHSLTFNYGLNALYFGFPFRATLFNANIPNSSDTFLLSFDYAKRARTATDLDTLRVFSIEGNTITYLATYNNSDLVTVSGVSTAAYIPAAATHWKTKTINLSSLKGKNNVILGFQFSTGKGGNFTWFDNVQLIKKSAGAVTSSTFQLVGGDSAFKSDNKTNSSIKPTLRVKNIKGSNVAGKWRATVKMLPLDWTFEICDPELCHPLKVTSGSFIQEKDSSDDFYVNFITNKIDGDGLIELAVWNTTDSAASRVLLKFRVKQGSGGSSVVRVEDAKDFYFSDNKLFFTGNKLPVKYNVFSTDGKKVYSHNITGSIENIGNAIPAGLYFIEVEYKNSTSQILKVNF